MTESDWMACADPTPMLAFLRDPPENWKQRLLPWLRTRREGDRPGERKLRLFVCLCRRCAWNLLADERSRTAVEIAERFVDGLATAEVRQQAFAAAEEVVAHFEGVIEGLNSEWRAANPPTWGTSDRPPLDALPSPDFYERQTGANISLSQARLAAECAGPDAERAAKHATGSGPPDSLILAPRERHRQGTGAGLP